MAGAALAFAAMAACPETSADEAPKADAPKPEPPKPLRVRPLAGKTYLYRFSESVTDRLKPGAPQAPQVDLVSRSEVVWEVGLSLQSVEANGDVVVSLLPARVSGRIEDVDRKPVTFDSDSPDSPVTSRLLGRGIRVRLSAAGRLSEDAGAGAPAELPAGLRSILDRHDPAPAHLFSPMIVQELPDEAPRAGGKWDTKRALPPKWTLHAGELSCTSFADVEERAAIEAVRLETISAGLVARGKRTIRRTNDPLDLGKGTFGDLEAFGEQLEEWFVTGEVRVRRDTGLVELRTTSATLATHFNPVRVKKPAGLPAAGGDGDALVAPATDHSYEITTRLELVGVR